MNEKEFLAFKTNHKNRAKMLDPYEGFVRDRLKDCPEASAAQVHDWLKECHPDMAEVNEKTVFNFVLAVRKKFGIDKPFRERACAQLKELDYGIQAQVDFGEYNMTTLEGGRKKVWFFSMVLSRSRQKYVVFRDAPFTTQAVIDAHEKCFQFYQGIPQQIVYDQDKLMLVDENYGDLLMTEQFKNYVQHRKLKTWFCRKADPQSKGKVENVIRYIKYNFLRGRKYSDIASLNEQSIEWLSRTANAKIHAATKKIPQKEWEIEKQYLNPAGEIIHAQGQSRSYTVRKDNTISYKGNFYQLPLHTWKNRDTKVQVKITDQQIIIYDKDNNEIARYTVSESKGKLITNNNFKRDFSIKIDGLIQELSQKFSQPKQAQNYMQKIRKDKPRYIRDQLLLIKKISQQYPRFILDMTLEFCMKQNILKATDFESMAEKLNVQTNAVKDNKMPKNIEIKSLNKDTHKISPDKRSISDYKSIMN